MHESMRGEECIGEWLLSISQLSQIQGREIPRLEAVKGQKEAEMKKLQAELNKVCVCVN